MQTVSAEPAAPTPLQASFHIEEYKSRPAGIAASIKTQIDLHILALVANGSAMAWLLSNHRKLIEHGPLMAKTARLIPLGVTLLAFNWSSLFGTTI